MQLIFTRFFFVFSQMFFMSLLVGCTNPNNNNERLPNEFDWAIISGRRTIGDNKFEEVYPFTPSGVIEFKNGTYHLWDNPSFDIKQEPKLRFNHKRDGTYTIESNVLSSADIEKSGCIELPDAKLQELGSLTFDPVSEDKFVYSKKHDLIVEDDDGKTYLTLIPNYDEAGHVILFYFWYIRKRIC